MGAEESSLIQRYNGERERLMNESNNGVKVTLVNPEVHVHNSRNGGIRDDGMLTIYSNTSQARQIRLLEEENREKEERILQLQREKILKEKADTDAAMLKMHNEILEKEKNLARQALQQEALAKEKVIIENERVVQQKKLQLEEQEKLIRTQKEELEKYKEITKNVLEKVQKVQRQVNKKGKQKPFSHNIKLPEQISLAGVENEMKNMEINSKNCPLSNDRKQINNVNDGKNKVGPLFNDHTGEKVGPVGSYTMGNYPPSTSTQVFMRNSNCQQIVPPFGRPLGTPPFEPPLGKLYGTHAAQFQNFNIPPPPLMDFDGNIKFDQQSILVPNMVKRIPPPPPLMDLDVNMEFNQQSNLVTNTVKRMPQQTNGRKKPSHNASATNNSTNKFKVGRHNYGESKRKDGINRNSTANEGAATKQRDNATEQSKENKVRN